MFICITFVFANFSPTTGTVPPKVVLSKDARKNPIPPIIKRQISRLKLTTQQLKSAKNGEDVFINDGEDEGSADGSASGSGSGSGRNEIPTDNSRVISPTDDNMVEDNMFGGGLSKDVLDTRSLGVPLQPAVWLVISCLYVLLKVVAL